MGSETTDERTPNEIAAEEIRTIGNVLARDAEGFFELGLFRAKKKLANGYTVTIEVKQGNQR